jgi:hypothetical protein
VPVHEGRAVYLGERAGFYKLSVGAGAPGDPSTTGSTPSVTAFAANLLDADESAIAPVAELTVDGKRAGAVEGFHIGVRREIWIYLLVLAALVTAIEWATYHRRLTV